jgi:hypothetical protein
MNSINRKFGRLMSKTPADSGKVSVLLSDYEDADTTLARVSVMISLLNSIAIY